MIRAIIFTILMHAPMAFANVLPYQCRAEIAEKIWIESEEGPVLIGYQDSGSDYGLLDLNTAIKNAFNDISWASLSQCNLNQVVSHDPPFKAAWQSGNYLCVYACNDLFEDVIDEFKDDALDFFLTQLKKQLTDNVLPIIVD